MELMIVTMTTPVSLCMTWLFPLHSHATVPTIGHTCHVGSHTDTDANLQTNLLIEDVQTYKCPLTVISTLNVLDKTTICHMYLHATILCSYMCERQFGHASNQYTHHTKKHPHTQLLGGAVVQWWCVVLYPDAYIYTSSYIT